MNRTPKFSGFVISLVSFSYGNPRNLDMGGITFIPGAQPIAATMSLGQKEKSWERSSWRRLLWTRLRKGTHHATHIPLERSNSLGYLTAREAGKSSRIRAEWVLAGIHLQTQNIDIGQEYMRMNKSDWGNWEEWNQVQSSEEHLLGDEMRSEKTQQRTKWK